MIMTHVKFHINDTALANVIIRNDVPLDYQVGVSEADYANCDGKMVPVCFDRELKKKADLVEWFAELLNGIAKKNPAYAACCSRAERDARAHTDQIVKQMRSLGIQQIVFNEECPEKTRYLYQRLLKTGRFQRRECSVKAIRASDNPENVKEKWIGQWVAAAAGKNVEALEQIAVGLLGPCPLRTLIESKDIVQMPD